MLPRRLAAIVLSMAFLSANTAVASTCEVYCAVESNVNHHHHQLKTRFSSHPHHPPAQHHNDMAGCPACPKSAGLTSPRPQECANEVQSLPGNLRVFSDECSVSQIDTARLSSASVPVSFESERFSSFHPPPKISNFEPNLVSLRI